MVESSLIVIDPRFDQIVAAALNTVAIQTRRTYLTVYRSWQAWALDHALPILAWSAGNVYQFLSDQNVTQKTRQRQLSAMRKLARVAALDYRAPEFMSLHESLMLLKAPHIEDTGTERVGRALNPAQVYKCLSCWQGDTLLAVRNHALICTLFLTGIRRSEAAALRWDDIDLQNGVIKIRHGKGNKEREAAIAGEMAIEALDRWRQRAGLGRSYVFCPVLKAGTLGHDKPITAYSIYLTVKETEQRTGVKFSPHDARRTFITEALSTGAALAEVQAQAGHAQASTTMIYAKASDAISRRQREFNRFRYGS